MSSPFNRIGFSPNCKDFLPPNPAAWPCALLISILYCLSSSRGKKPCLPPRGVARINKLQSTPKKMDEISSDSLKYIAMTTSIISRCHGSEDKRAGLEISSTPPTCRVIARPKSYILIFKLSVVLYQSHLAERNFVWTLKAPELAQQKATALNH